MGRPTDAQIDTAIGTVESVQTDLDDQIEAYEALLRSLLIPPERIPDPAQPMNGVDNEARLKYVRQQLTSATLADGAAVTALLGAIQRAASMIMTVVTAIRQVDQRLETFGVTSVS